MQHFDDQAVILNIICRLPSEMPYIYFDEKWDDDIYCLVQKAKYSSAVNDIWRDVFLDDW
jgi:hypothetical protein